MTSCTRRHASSVLAVGGLLLAAAFALDALVHAIGGPQRWEDAAHFSVFVAMVAALAGVIGDGLARHHRRSHPRAMRR